MKTATKRPRKAPDADPKRQTVIYLTESISTRLGRFLVEKHAGKTGMRNQLILDALDEMLKKEGF